MSGDFEARMTHFLDTVGAPGRIIAQCEVDQVYAHIQEVSDEFKHLRGGQSRYLSTTLFEDLDGHLQRIGETLVTPDGCRIADGMIDFAEALSDGVMERAPIEFNDLKRSGHPTVIHDGTIVYDRPPEVARLTETELRAKEAHGRRGGDAASWDELRRAMAA